MAPFYKLGCMNRKDYASPGPVRGLGHKLMCHRVLLATLVIALYLMAGSIGAAPQVANPNAQTVKTAVEQYFVAVPNYQAGDLITRSQIEKLLAKFDDAGVPVPAPEELAARGVADSSFIARELSTAGGRKFMRRLASTPGAFSHVDRLSSISGGEQLIRDLVRGKDGDKLIEYLATTKGGQKMGKMMSAVPSGTDLNRPTGRIYTAADLVAAINAAYASAQR
jgi:hypothetical protein